MAIWKRTAPLIVAILLSSTMAVRGQSESAIPWSTIPNGDMVASESHASSGWLKTPLRWARSTATAPMRQLGTGTRRAFSRTRGWLRFDRTFATDDGGDGGAHFPAWGRPSFSSASSQEGGSGDTRGFFSSLFRRDEPEPLGSPHKWLAQKRPEP